MIILILVYQYYAAFFNVLAINCYIFTYNIIYYVVSPN